MVKSELLHCSPRSFYGFLPFVVVRDLPRRMLLTLHRVYRKKPTRTWSCIYLHQNPSKYWIGKARNRKISGLFLTFLPKIQTSVQESDSAIQSLNSCTLFLLGNRIATPEGVAFCRLWDPVFEHSFVVRNVLAEPAAKGRRMYFSI